MKRKLLLALSLVLALSITACSKEDKDKPVVDGEDKTPVQDIDTPEDDNSTEEKPEEEQTSNQWPEGFMEKAPKFEEEINIVKQEGPNKYFIQFQNVEYDDTKEYIESIKEAGFTQNVNENTNSNSLKYKGMDSENNLMIFYWGKDGIAKLELIKKNN